MPTSRPFAFNTGSTISGTNQFGQIAVGGPNAGNYSNNYGGVRWFMGPDEDEGWVIAQSVPTLDQPNPDNAPAGVGFFRTSGFSDSGFIELVNVIAAGSGFFSASTDSYNWLISNGYWTSFTPPTPTPTPTSSSTPTPTPTPTRTLTPTPSSAPAVDSIRAQLTTAQQATYDAASVGDWIKVTSTQYTNIVNNVTGATKKGNTDVQVNTRSVATSFSNQWIAFGLGSTPSFQINNGEYVIAMITEAWNQSGGNSQLGFTTSFTGTPITNYGGTAGPTSGGVRDYFVRKAPIDIATETRYPVLFMTVSPNAVLNWNGFRSADNGVTWTANSSSANSKIQIVTTTTKSW